MFILFRLTVAIALLVYVGFAAQGAKDRFMNHDPDWYRAPVASSTLASAFGGVKDYMTSRNKSDRDSGGRLFSNLKFVGSGSNNGSRSDEYHGGYLKSRPENVGKTTAETACEFYPDQCNK